MYLNEDFELSKELEKKMQQYEAQRNYEIKSNQDNPLMRKKLEYLKNQDRIGKEFQDTDVNSIEKDESIKKVTLSDFYRTSIESSFNFYQQNYDGSPSAMRNRIRGYVYKTMEGNVACKIVVEQRNNKVLITEFYVAPEYMGYGLSHELLNIAKNVFGANGAIMSISDNFSIGFLQKNNFMVVGQRKDKVFLELTKPNTLNESVVHLSQNAPSRTNNRPVPPFRFQSGTGLNNPANKNDKKGDMNLSSMSMKTTKFDRDNVIDKCEQNTDSKRENEGTDEDSFSYIGGKHDELSGYIAR